MRAMQVALSALALGLVSFSGLTGCIGEITSPGAGAGGQESAESPGDGSAEPASQCAAAAPRAPLRRLTIFEYNNTARDLIGNCGTPASTFPSEELGNGFGNDAYAQPAPISLITEYGAAAETLASLVTGADRLLSFAPCAAGLVAGDDLPGEKACAASAIEAFAPRAFRRPLRDGEAATLLALFEQVRALAGETFGSALAAVVAAILQDPHFLYRPELGVPVPGRADVRQPSGYEMASRLSYYLWGSTPDMPLLSAAASGELLTSQGIQAQAERMLTDPRAREMVRFFFDNLLPIAGLSQLERDPAQYPAFNAQIGALMRLETETFVDHQIFAGPGSFSALLSGNTSFLNEELATYYGVPGVVGPEFREVTLDGVQRGGLLTQGGIVAGPIHSNHTNPVTRGAFVLRKLLCTPISVPTDPAIAAQVKPPEPYSGATARERFSLHSAQAACAGCHKLMDPIGFALENFDAVGRWRDQENGVLIDASGETPMLPAPFVGAVELGKQLAASEQAQHCFTSHWLSFAYGRSSGQREACTGQELAQEFVAGGGSVKALLVALTQTNEFLYLPAVRE